MTAEPYDPKMEFDRRLVMFGIVVAGLGSLVGCNGTADDAQRSETNPPPTAAPASPNASSTTTGQGGAPSAPPLPPPTTPAPANGPSATCGVDATVVLGSVQNPGLIEASGLVASRTHPDVLWSHNDGDDATLYGLGIDGTDLGSHPLVGVEAIDIEDIAIVSGESGDDVLLADIGDNGLRRESVRIFRFPEPHPSGPGPITEIDVREFTYPDGAHNAETLLVDEANRTVVIVTKEQQTSDGRPDARGATRPSFVFEGQLDAEGSGPIELRPVGTIDTPLLSATTTSLFMHPASVLGFGGVPTGGDVSIDGTRVAVRTYEAVWVWTRGDDESVAEVFAADPCEVTSAFEPQGEAIAFTDSAVITVGEGQNPPLHRLGG